MNNLLSEIKIILNDNCMHLITAAFNTILIVCGIWYFNQLLQNAIAKLGHKSKIADESIVRIFQSITYILMYILGAVLILQNLHIQISSLLGMVGILTVGAGLALQNIVGNMAAGIFILCYKPFTIGDYISCNHPHSQFEGKISDINLRSTTLEQDNNIIIVPNQILYETVITIKKQNKYH